LSTYQQLNIFANIRIPFLLAFFGFGRIKKELCSINQVIEY